MKHIFAVCAYGESLYLEECIKSLVEQTSKSEIFISTSTPNEHISKVAEKYGLKVVVNNGPSGITEDWNYAYSQTDADLVTIAHQDDTYAPEYAEKIIENYGKATHPLIVFSDYAELRNGEVVSENTNLKIKRILLRKLRNPKNWGKKRAKRSALAYGCSICCPAVTLVKPNLPDQVYENHFRSDEDWEAWEKLSRLDGEFVYVPEMLMYHRVHEDSATTEIINDNSRTVEDYEMFCKFWPKWFAKLITKVYLLSEKSNNIK